MNSRSRSIRWLLVFDDRLEVRTPGGLPNSARLDQLPAGIHVRRNSTVYNLLLKRGLVTDAGSGIPRMSRLLREKTGLDPDLRIEGTEFVVELTRTDLECTPGQGRERGTLPGRVATGTSAVD